MKDNAGSELLEADILEYLLSFQSEEKSVSNFFDTGGAGYLENPTSDLMALFMGKDGHTNPWLLKAFLKICGHDIEDIDLSSSVIMREATTDNFSRLDIFVKHDDFIIGIENKVWADTNNPFPDYETFLEDAIDNGQEVYRCILKPDSNPALGIDGWRTITYSMLVKSAQESFGQEILDVEFNKWTIFYREFLQHLLSLSGLTKEVAMKDADVRFVEENFHALIKAEDVLAQFKEQIKTDAVSVVSQILSTENIEISTNNWEGNYKAIHLTPASWGKSCLSIVYYPSTTDNGLLYYVNAWIAKEDFININDLHNSLKNDNSHPEIKALINKDSEIKITKPALEVNYLGFNADKSLTLDALKILTLWMSKILQK